MLCRIVWLVSLMHGWGRFDWLIVDWLFVERVCLWLLALRGGDVNELGDGRLIMSHRQWWYESERVEFECFFVWVFFLFCPSVSPSRSGFQSWFQFRDRFQMPSACTGSYSRLLIDWLHHHIIKTKAFPSLVCFIIIVSICRFWSMATTTSWHQIESSSRHHTQHESIALVNYHPKLTTMVSSLVLSIIRSIIRIY